MKFIRLFTIGSESWRRIVSLMLAMVSAIAFSGCSLSQFKTEAAQVPQLVQHIVGEPKTFNYALSQESPNVFDLIYDSMVFQNGVTGEIEPALAESWKISDDKKRIVFTLREGLKWSDGAPLTADDVMFTYNDIYFNEEIPTDIRDIFRLVKVGHSPRYANSMSAG
jgi:peptide/nickel transport system substrate-binding protein